MGQLLKFKAANENPNLDLAISVGCQDVGDVRQKGRGLYDPVMQNGCSVRAFDPIPIRPLEKESLWPFSLHFYTFRVTSHSYGGIHKLR